jgi:hypothetical protein
MRLLRRWFAGRSPDEDPAEPDETWPDATTGAATSAADPDADERKRERELLRAEAERLDELQQRQLRYANRAWTPPPQGGERRADDEDAAGEG